MIDEIQVENLALIRKAALEPASGLTVLTGETGAGKTALVSALKLLMGERADKGSVRDGQDALVVSGRFFVSGAAGAEGEGALAGARAGGEAPAASGAPGEGAADGLAEGGAPAAPSASDGDAQAVLPDEGELVATRRVGADGRSRATVNGRMASVGELAGAVAPTVDLCGQHEHQQLMKPAVPRAACLDAWAGERGGSRARQA